VTIDTNDLLFGFVWNYHFLRIEGEMVKYSTTWTHRLLGYFDTLGRLLGHLVILEKERYDLGWWDNSTLFLHVEHENKQSFDRIVNQTLLKKLFPSEAKLGIGICYPKSSDLFEEIIEYVEDYKGEISPDEVLLILDGHAFKKDEIPFVTLTYKKGDTWKKQNFLKTIAPDDFYCIQLAQ